MCKSLSESDMKAIQEWKSSLNRWMVSMGLQRPPITPKPGESWVLKPRSGDPFGSYAAQSPVTVLDVRDGWVRYKMVAVFRDERCTIQSFVSTYERVEKGEEANG
jgi:hypothetical protein